MPDHPNVHRIEENTCWESFRMGICHAAVKDRQCKRTGMRVFHKAYIAGKDGADTDVYLCPIHRNILVRKKKLDVVWAEDYNIPSRVVELRTTADVIME
jgi:hypothetical protein